MWKLKRYLKGYGKESIIGPLFKLLEACFELIVPIIMANIIDVGIKNRDYHYILSLGGVLVFLGLLGLTCSLTAQYFAAKAGMGFGTALRNDLFAHINGLSYTELDAIGTSSLITRMTSDINQTQTGINLLLRLFSRSPFIVIGAFIMAFTISKKIALIFVITIPILALIIYGIMLITMPIYKKVQSILDKVSLSTRNNLVGNRVIRAFCRQEDEIQEFETTSDHLCQTQIRVGRISGLLNPFTYVVVNIAIIAIVWQGGYQVNEGAISQGEVIALVNYMTQILLALIALANLIVAATKASASASRINDVFTLKSSMIEGNRKEKVEGNEESNKVEFSHVTFTYKDAGEPSLTDISFTAKKGETIGIIGGTGDGKSTLVNLIPRFYDASEGQVLIDGVNVKEYTYEALRNKVAVVPQKALLFKGTIEENLRWGNQDAKKEELLQAITIAQATEFVMSKEKGLESMLSQGGSNLSGGQKQRLAIARALVSKADILILDDSSSALDYATDANLRHAIKKLAGDKTVFIVSQRTASIKDAHKILVLEDGNLVGMGTHEELLNTCEEYQEICSSQLSREEVKEA